MSFFRTCAAILTLVLIAQNGCNFFCQHGEETRSATNSQGPVQACHESGDHQAPTHNQSSNHEVPKDCVHPQAVGDNPKFETKIAKPTLVAIAIEFPSLDAHFGANAFTDHPVVVRGIKPPGPPTSPSVLRI